MAIESARAGQHQPIPWFSIGLLSAAALAYEVLLTRLFALVHWHHLVSMIIGLALLGYGASGGFLSLLGSRRERHFRALFLGNALLFSLGTVLAFDLARRLPLDPRALPWEPRQMLYLCLVYSLMALPFFGVANCIGLALGRFRDRGHQVYAVDLLGAGLGALGMIGVLYLLAPGQALALVAIVALLGTLLAALELRAGRTTLILLALTGTVAVGLQDPHVPGAAYKSLSQTLQVSGARLDARAAGPLGVISLVHNEQVPVRHAPGLSLLSGSIPPPQLALFVDGDAAGVVSAFDGRTPPPHLAALTSALPYELLRRPSVLILAPGGGDGLLQALGQGASGITAVEPHAPLLRLLQKDYAEFNGALARRPEVHWLAADPRAYVETNREYFDLIQLDRSGRSGLGGLQAQDEAYEYTLEAVTAYLSHLKPDGLLAISLGLQLPPRASLRLVATARAALTDAGVVNSGLHLAMIRGWRTFTLVLSKTPLGPQRVQAVREFCRRYAFDPVWFPGIEETEVNRFNRLEQPWLYLGVQALLGSGARGFIKDYVFRIEPVSDERPYFHRFTRPGSIPDLLALPAGSGFSQVDWGYGFQLATLLQAMGLALLFILLPLGLIRGGARLRWRTLGYFALIGMAFMFMEIAFIQRFRLLLGHPVYAIAVVLTGFLLFAGLGSYLSGLTGSKLSRMQDRDRLSWAILSIVGLTLLYLWLLPPLFQSLMVWPLSARIGACLLLIAPLALAMGMPFPLGLAHLQAQAPTLVPWAWGINGSASVVSVVAAPLLAMEVGFSGLLLAAAGLYLVVRWIGLR